jgi:protein TonB
VASSAAAQDVQTVGDAIRAIEAAHAGTTTAAAPPTPVSNPGTWVTTEDYPAWAVANRVEGRVSFVVDVDKAGRVTRCEVREGSGVADLDKIACDKITERALFRPGTDEDGNPVAGSWSSTVVWRLSDEQEGRPAPPAAQFVLNMVVERDGSVSECVVEKAEGAALAAQSACDQNVEFQPVLGEDGQPQRTRIRVTTHVEHERLP